MLLIEFLKVFGELCNLFCVCTGQACTVAENSIEIGFSQKGRESPTDRQTEIERDRETD